MTTTIGVLYRSGNKEVKITTQTMAEDGLWRTSHTSSSLKNPGWGQDFCVHSSQRFLIEEVGDFIETDDAKARRLMYEFLSEKGLWNEYVESLSKQVREGVDEQQTP